MREIRRILDAVPGVHVVSLQDVGIAYDPAEERLEPHDTFEANARSKARYFMAKSGLATVADDSGLEVDALGGAPGVRTKRFAPLSDVDGAALDEANNLHLLERLHEVAPERRSARYVCVAALSEPGRDPVTFRGEATGVVLDEPRGQGGFGYDPLILDPVAGKTFAEMSSAEKDARSHRGAAFRQLAEVLAQRVAHGA